MSNSVQPHRQQPTRLPCPWDSPGNSTGVGCHFLLQCMKVKSELSQSCPTLSNPMDCSLPGLLRPWDFPGKSTGVRCHCLLRKFSSFNFAYLFFLSFLSLFPLNVFVSFIFIALFQNWHLALVLCSSLCFTYLVFFLTDIYNFSFPLSAGSIYCTLFLLDCFDFAHSCICICVCSIVLIIICLTL